VLALPGTALAFDIPSLAATDPTALEQAGYDLYLAISINGQSCEKVVAVHQEADGSLSVTPEDLGDIGLLAPGPEAILPDGRIALDRLADVTYVFDAARQSIEFTAPDTARARLIISADGSDYAPDASAPEQPATGFGALLNYDIYASASMTDGGDFSAAPLSGTFEARAFSPFGVLEQSFSVLTAPVEFRRLNTTWSYSDPRAMRTYRAGDIATGALSWTRSSRLGGLQVQNDFGLRSDIVTYPVPSISGSAALPSSVDIYINNSNRYSGSVPAGPFDIVDVPVLTGAGTMELVVRDATGKQVVTKADYFASPRLLKPGLMDYSAELGFARTNFGADGDGYDKRLMASGSIRTGVADWLTWEGHAEGGAELINAGTGIVAALGRLGTGQFSVAGSKTREAAGVQVTGSVQLGFGPVTLGARAQRSFGRYEDIASLTTPGVTSHSAAAPAALYQLSLSLPTPFAGGRANLSYTQVEPASGDAAQIIAASYGQRLFGGSASASAYMDMKRRNYGVTMSLWMPLGGDMTGGASIHHANDGTSLTANIGHSGGNDVGDVGWQVSLDQDDHTDFSASARARLPAATLHARAAHAGKQAGLSGELSGAVVAAGGGLFFSNPVRDAFAVVDVGASGVPVLYQNRVVGVTGRNGKLLVPGLAAYQKNRLSIDPLKLPLDRVVDDTTAVVSPARGSGVVVTFGERVSGGTALVSFRDSKGAYLPLASTGMTSVEAPEFVIGYDGAALLEGLGPDNSVTIALPDGSSCAAEVPYTASGGDLVNIQDVVCRPV